MQKQIEVIKSKISIVRWLVKHILIKGLKKNSFFHIGSSWSCIIVYASKSFRILSGMCWPSTLQLKEQVTSWLTRLAATFCEENCAPLWEMGIMTKNNELKIYGNQQNTFIFFISYLSVLSAVNYQYDQWVIKNLSLLWIKKIYFYLFERMCLMKVVASKSQSLVICVLYMDTMISKYTI